MLEVLAAVAGASLLGSPHCAGMCGPFLAFAAGSGASQLAYHAGRLSTYLLLGTLAGLIGAAIDGATAWVGLPRLAGILAGGVMVLWGATVIARESGLALPRLRVPAGLVTRARSALAVLRARPPLTRGLAVGLLTTLLPCGWLYAFVVTAAGTASPMRGALVMTVFWLGSLPLLAGLGAGIAQLSSRARALVPRVSAAVLMIAGALAIAGRLELAPPSAHGQAPTPSTHVPAEPPCHDPR